MACIGQSDSACICPTVAGGLTSTTHSCLGLFESWLSSACSQLDRHVISTEHTDTICQASRVPLQVHLARLNGQRVVVKVQRPGLKDLFDIDLKNVRVLAQWLQNLDPKSDGAARDWVAIYDECARILYQVSSVLKCLVKQCRLTRSSLKGTTVTDVIGKR